MAFDKKNFQPVGGQGGRGKAPQRFSYKSADVSTVVDAVGYFNEVRGFLELGDIIDVVQVDSVTAPTSVTAVGQHVVVNKTTTTVDVSDATVIAVTDTR